MLGKQTDNLLRLPEVVRKLAEEVRGLAEQNRELSKTVRTLVKQMKFFGELGEGRVGEEEGERGLRGRL